ncbi:MAG TPA: AarF/UbiB family protein [Balneolales bacterium]|nr:AarF/UbiB family protein [Balneolales bacterium]
MEKSAPTYISKNTAGAEGISARDGQQNLNGRKPNRKQPEFHPLAPYKGVPRRILLLYRHVTGLLAGGLIAFVKAMPPEKRRRLHTPFKRLLALLLRPFVNKELRNLPFPVQLRRRLEMLGPTYIKLGQILSIREDILPEIITDELKNLLDRLPVVPFSAIRNIVEDELGQPLKVLFESVEEEPLASASIAQAHRARTNEGDEVVLKVVKPGIRSSIISDLKLLRMLGSLLEWLIPRYQPKVIIDEFCTYTEKEVDLTYEADNAELFAANFKDQPNVIFPMIYRALSTRNVLCMEFLDGFKPGSEQTKDLSEFDRQLLVDYGAGAIIKMLYEDGFFHADLHPANLLIMKGSRVGFIDLGMVGRFSEKTRRYLLFYFNALVNGDVEGSTKYLLSIAKMGKGCDPAAFRRAVGDLFRRFQIYSAYGQFSLGKLILESLRVGGQFSIFFPVEMTLMVKALVTFEGVGLLLDPNLDIPSISRRHIGRIYRDQYDPRRLARQLMRSGPELADLIMRLPDLLSDGSRYLENAMTERQPSDPMAGIRNSILAGSCIVSGVFAYLQHAPFYTWLTLFLISLTFIVFGKKS